MQEFSQILRILKIFPAFFRTTVLENHLATPILPGNFVSYVLDFPGASLTASLKKIPSTKID